ncbi:MAG: hypothetical protein FWE72_06785 [Spirochaetaceae bacterium]|nr:hypothetical protein [Spirochaetaceae bacterium]
MKLTTSRNIKYLILIHVAFMIFIALYSFFIIKRPAVQVLTPPYLLISTLTIYSQLFLPISAGALFILIILSNKNRYPESKKENGVEFLRSIIPVLIPTALIYIFLVFFAEPILIEKKMWFEELSKSGEFYLAQTEKKLAEGNLEEALVFIDLYLYIDPDNKYAVDLKGDIKIAWPNTIYPDGTSEEKIKAISGDFITGQMLLEIAEKYYEQEDYSSAAYYGKMAGMFRNSRDKANQVLKKAIEKITTFFPDTSAKEKLFDGKIDITKRIESEDFYGAYYYYHMLSEEFPEDQELTDIGTRLFSLLSEKSFFYEDIRILYFAPGKTEIAFINGNGLEKELVFAKKIVLTNDGIYFFDINIINLSPSGQIVRHIKSLYGKVIENRLSLQCLGREVKLLLYPEVIVGNKSDRISSIDLEIPSEALLYMGLEENRFLKIKTLFLLENLDLLSESGAGKYAPSATLFIRFIRIFNYIFMLMLVVSSGISFLKRRSDKTYLSLLALPAVVIAIYFIERTIMYINSKILSIFMKETGISGAALCFTVIIIIELIAVILYTKIKASSIESYRYRG